MNQKALGIILIIFGGYLAIGNTIFSILFNYAGPIGFHVPLSPQEYWTSWCIRYGSMTIFVAAAGIFFIFLGSRKLMRIKNDMTITH